jgi:predicted trehalose synthase
MLGLIQSKRQRWNTAARHLTTAADFYRKKSNVVMTVHAHHALAYVPFEQGNFGHACAELKTVLTMAKALPEAATRDRLVQLIQDDLDEAVRHLVQPA